MNDSRKPIGLPVHADRTGAMPALGGALPWRTWTAGLEEARSRRVPLLVVAESPWANSAQRLALVLGRDERLRPAVEEQVVPVLADPHDAGAPGDRWRWSAVQLAGTVGPPLMLVLTEEGLPFLAYTSMQYEGDDLFPSLTSVLTTARDAYVRDRDAVITEARALADQFVVDGDAPSPAGVTFRDQIVPALDMSHGGIDDLPRHPHPQLLWYAQSLSDAEPETPLARPWLERTLATMVRGGIRDQLGGGFHRCARDERWVIPHFEKPVALNAQLAAVYARAAVQFDRPEFRTVAAELVDFCQTALRQRVDVVGSDTPYYTWTSTELLQGVDRACVQPLGLHYHIVPGAARQALHQAVPTGDLGKFSHVPVEDMIALLKRGQRQMLAARQRRPQPELIRLSTPSRQAETIRWLYRAAVWDVPVDEPLLADALGRISAGRGATGQVGADEVTALEDEVSILLAMLAAHGRPRDDRWLHQAARLGAAIREHFVTAEGVSNLPVGSGRVAISWAVVDTDIPATVAGLVEGFATLGNVIPDESFRREATRIAQAYAGPATACGPWAASLWNAYHALGDQR